MSVPFASICQSKLKVAKFQRDRTEAFSNAFYYFKSYQAPILGLVWRNKISNFIIEIKIIQSIHRKKCIATMTYSMGLSLCLFKIRMFVCYSFSSTSSIWKYDLRIQKNVDKLYLSVSEVFDYLSTKINE